MTPLRQRMIEDMPIRNFTEQTQTTYCQYVSQFARHFHRSPELLGPEEIRAYQHYLVHERKLSASSLFVAVGALRFPLTTRCEKKTLAGKNVFSVADGALLICLDRELTLDVIRAIADLRPERVVCLDEGFTDNDQLKANAVQTFKTKGITSGGRPARACRSVSYAWMYVSNTALRRAAGLRSRATPRCAAAGSRIAVSAL